MIVPLLDLHAQHAGIRPELDQAIAGVLQHGRYVNGPEVPGFEHAFAEFCETSEAIGCSSGTDALTLILRASGIGPGDEVITTTMTFIATLESIVEVGATPVVLDCDPETALLEADAVTAAIGPRTAAVVPVHLYGQPVDLDAFRAVADRYKLLLIEDAAQAHGACWNGRRAGSIGDASAFSFFPGKNLGALGDAGAITTHDRALADRLRRLRDHGRLDKYRHELLGVNARLDSLQAAVLHVKLRHLEAWNEARRAHAVAYDAALRGSGAEPLHTDGRATHAYHQYVVRVADRERAQERLAGRGIATGVHYPVAVHRQPAAAGLVEPESCPNADRLAAAVLSVPISPELNSADRDRVIEELLAHAADSAVPAAS